ncbi:MAG: hypothetical protein ABJQ70_08325 [Roseobacter sp.]
MKLKIFILSTMVVMSGCDVPPSTKKPGLEEVRAANAELREEAFTNSKLVEVDSLQFKVSFVKGSYSQLILQSKYDSAPIEERNIELGYVDKPYALVELVDPKTAKYTPEQVEKAAQLGTGCSAKFSAGVLAFVGGTSATMDLQELSKKVSRFKGWSAKLSC